jgi:hypothetical protein
MGTTGIDLRNVVPGESTGNEISRFVRTEITSKSSSKVFTLGYISETMGDSSTWLDVDFGGGNECPPGTLKGSSRGSLIKT